MNDIKLDFENVLIVPKSSKKDILSREQVNLEINYTFKNGIKWQGIPIIASNMTTIGTFEMYQVLSKYKLITCFHKYYTKKDFQNINFNLDKSYYMISSGITDKDFKNLIELIKFLNPMFVCIDIANGYLISGRNFVKKLKKMYPNLIICFGNVISEVDDLSDNYLVDIIKIGIGSGSACSTRLKTGIGYPQLSAILENNNKMIISDGGCIVPGDISKAFGAGASFVMIGGLLAGHFECSGNIIEEDGKQFKEFYGMSSLLSMNKFNNGVKTYKTTEGHILQIPYKGFVGNTINDILGGLRSTCTYLGITELSDLKNNCQFIKVLNQNNKSLL